MVPAVDGPSIAISGQRHRFQIDGLSWDPKQLSLQKFQNDADKVEFTNIYPYFTMVLLFFLKLTSIFGACIP